MAQPIYPMLGDTCSYSNSTEHTELVIFAQELLRASVEAVGDTGLPIVRAPSVPSAHLGNGLPARCGE
jgi:hypothetical protein